MRTPKYRSFIDSIFPAKYADVSILFQCDSEIVDLITASEFSRIILTNSTETYRKHEIVTEFMRTSFLQRLAQLNQYKTKLKIVTTIYQLERIIQIL